MKNWYKLTGILLLLICVGKQVKAQTHFGQGAGTQGVGHSFFGLNAGSKNTGEGNSFYGSDAGAENAIGHGNSFYGFEAGKNGASNETGSFFGYMAGQNTSNTIGNVFVGAMSGQNTQASYNVFLGVKAGVGNETGSNNIYLGNSAGASHKTGDNNVVVGGTSFAQGESGSDNCIMGVMAGLHGYGSRNVYLGMECGKFAFSSSDNSFIGYLAGYNSTGSYNVFIGGETGVKNSGMHNCFLGTKAGYENTTGNGNLFLGYQAGLDNVDGAQNTYVGYSAKGNPNLNNATAVGAQAKVSSSNSLVLGHKANVGIGVSAPAFQLQLSTDAAAKAGSALWTVASDSRLKKNITDFTDGLDLLKQIHPVWFQYNGKAGIETGDKKFVGIIAQEMQKAAPYTIGTFMHQDSSGNKTEYLDYDANAITYVLINSVKEQQRIIEEKEKEIGDLQHQVAVSDEKQHALEARLEKLEQWMSATGHFRKGEEGALPTLEQNRPNGFSDTSQIKFFVPNAVKDAAINVYTNAGLKVHSYAVNDRGESSLTISASDFPDGIFLYELVTDGKSSGVRKMLISK